MSFQNRVLISKSALFLVLFVFSAPPSFANQQTNSEDYFSMSLEELLSIEVSVGTLTGSIASKVPFARTVITAEDIAVTPARSILDLLEVYVPGATFVNSFQGSRFGFRGILGDQNFHYSLLVNGKNMNLNVNQGPFAEIFNRDLSDIQKIEIIRGPGSATYGPGAIGGVINIITHSAESSPGLRMGGEVNENYRYQNIHASYGKKIDPDVNYYLTGSFSNSDGEKDTQWYYVDRENGYGYGYMGEDWGNKNTGSPVTHFYGDALDKPQVKLHGEFNFHDVSGWMRYTGGSQYDMQEISHYQDGDDFHAQEWDVFATELKYNYLINDQWHLETSAGFDSFSYRQISAWQGTNEPQENILQYQNNYSENEYNLLSILSYIHNDKFKYAAGLEYSYEYYAPRWGDDDDDYLMQMPAPVNFSTLSESSPFYQKYGAGTATVIDAPHIQMYSALMEANMTFHKYLQLLLSGRADKNELSTWAYSPRIALITEITDNDTLKMIWQKSVRLPNMPELYVADYVNDSSPEHETLENYEIMFGHTKDKISYDFNLFYNILDEVQYTTTGSAVIGQLDMWGFDAEALLQGEHWQLGANYSYIKQDSWQWLDSSVIPSQNLSDDAGGSLTIPEYADNRINNFPSNTIKMFWNEKWFGTFSTHVNTRFSWDHNQKELLQEFLAAHNADGTTETQTEMRAIYDDMTGHGYGEPSFTMNASAAWKLPFETETTLTIYAMNLLSYNHVRYGIQFYEPLEQEYSRQSTFIEEPVSVGIKLEIAF